jgi:hypothetical protein
MSVVMRHVDCDRILISARGRAPRGTALSDSISITPNLAADQRGALEQLLFFNVNQHRVRLGIQQSIEIYGEPEIHERDGSLYVRVGDVEGVETLFAVSEVGHPLGVAVFVNLPEQRFVVLHLGVEPRLRSSADVNTPVLMKLMHEIRSKARRTRGVERIELVYKERHSMRLNV